MVDIQFGKKKALGIFQLVMINVIAVDSIRTLPFSAAYGFSLIFYYLLAAIFFFIPVAFVAAELGTGWPTTGGVYVWVREAFGKKWSLVAIWLNWVYNIVWYPTIIALIAGTAAYFINPSLSENKVFMAVSVLIIFWLSTWINCYGMKVSGLISVIGATIGTILPMILISLLGFYWWKKDNPLAIDVSYEAFFPSLHQGNNLAFLTNVLFGLMGLEMAATHASEMRNPQRDYPKSLFISMVIILATIMASSLAIAFIVPQKDLSLATGAIQAFSLFFTSLNIDWGVPIIAGLIILGGISGMSAWIIGPSKGLMVASEDGSLPSFLRRKNKYGVPYNVLIIQAILVSILSFIFLFFDTVNTSFWILSAITAQLALLVYILLFASALRLHYQKPEIVRSFKVPLGQLGIWMCSSFGILSCIIVFGLGFIPPLQIDTKSVGAYEICLILGIVIIGIIPFGILRLMTKNRKD
jgi:amino acid transporter